MRSMRKLLIVICVAGQAIAAVPSVSASSPIATIQLTKACGPVDPSICVVTSSSNPGVIPVESTASFSGPRFDPHLSSGLTLTTPDGTATGHCSLSWTTGAGLCVFSGGTGSLAGFHAHLDEQLLDADTLTFGLSGTYHFE